MDIWFNCTQILFDGAVVYGFIRVNRSICEALKNHKRAIEGIHSALANHKTAVEELYNMSLFGTLPKSKIKDISKSNDKE